MSTQTLQLLSQSHWLADGSQTVWNFTFTGGYINQTHVRAYYKSPADVRTDLTINYDTDFVGPFQLSIAPAVPSGYTLVIYRDSSNGGLPLVDFSDGANVDEKNLDVVAKQSVFVSAETEDFLGVTTEADLVALGQAAAAAAGTAVAAATSSSLSATIAGGHATFADAASNAAAASATSASTSAANAAAAAASAVGVLTSTLASASGSSGVGWQQFGTGATFRTVLAKLRDRVNVLDFGADPTGVVDSYTAFVNAFATGKPVDAFGTFKVGTSLNLISNQKVALTGMQRHCIINYTGAAGTFLFDMTNISDVIDQTFIIEGVHINCSGGNSGISAQHRHMYVIRNSSIYGAASACYLKQCWIGELDNVDFYGGVNLMTLDGDVNRLAIRSCRFVNHSGYALTANSGSFGCLAVVLDNCDIEFSGGKGIVWNTYTTCSVRDCYIGDGMFQACFEISAGQVHVDGGVVIWGTQASFAHVLVSFQGAVPGDGRSILIENAVVNGATYCGPDGSKMILGTGKVGIRNCRIATTPFWNGARVILPGDNIMELPGRCALSNNGLTGVFSGTGGVTASTTTNLTSGSKTFTVTNGGTAAFIDLALDVGKLSTFTAPCVVLVYSSNSAWALNLSTAVTNGGSNLDITGGLGVAGLPSTGGAISTLLVYNQNALTLLYSYLELARGTPAVNDTVTIYKAYVFDTRTSGAPGPLYVLNNIYAPN